MKGRYHWSIGATSFVLPADVSENVDFLAQQVDDIQLLFFESESKSSLPHEVDVPYLKNIASEYNVTYTVHLPTDLSLGSSKQVVRNEAVAEILRLMEKLAPVSPQAFDLHLNLEPGVEELFWLENLHQSLSLLADRLGSESSSIAVENIDYPFLKVKPLVLEHGFSLCLDFGHALRYGEEITQFMQDISLANHIHLHGVEGGRDHQAISPLQEELSRNVGVELGAKEFSGVLTVEVYNRGAFEQSMEELARVWGEFELQT